ncbi:glycosyltransferase [Vibrio breoganii]
MKKIILHYPFIPTYRKAIFELLNDDKDYEFTFLSDLKPKTDIKSADTSKLNVLRTKYIPFKVNKNSSVMEIEFGVITRLIYLRSTHSVYVCLGSPNILTSWLYSLVARLLGYEVYFWTQGVNSRESGVKKLIRKLYLSIPNGLLLYGNRADEILTELNLNTRRKVIYNSLDYDLQEIHRKALDKEEVKNFRNADFSNNSIVITCMGRLHKKLNIKQAIEFSSKYNINSSRKIELQIIGDGPIRRELELLAKKLDVSVVFRGAVHDEGKLSIMYAISDASLICGTVGLAAIHSLSYGIPVITHDDLDSHCPEVESIIDGKTGFYFQKNDFYSFSNCIGKLIDSSFVLHDNCIKEVQEKWSPRVQCRRILEALG